MIRLALFFALLASPAAADPISAIASVLGITSTVGLAALRVVVGLGMLLITQNRNKPKDAGIRTSATSTGGIGSQSFILGNYATAGNLVAPLMSHGESGDTPNAYRTMVIDLADVSGFTPGGFYLDDVYFDFATTMANRVHAAYGMGVDPALAEDYAGRVWAKVYDGNQTAADPMLLSKYGTHPDRPWSSDMIGRGVPYIIITLKYDREIFQSDPAVLVVGDGLRLYDPRKDSTVGGSGAHRLDDDSTWEFTQNAVVMIYNLLIGLQIDSQTRFGLNVDPDDIPLDGWFAAMNASGPSSGFRAGYEVFIADDEPLDVIDALLASFGGEICDNGGEWLIKGHEIGLPTAFFTDDDFLRTEDSGIDPFNGLTDTFNGVNINYISPEMRWQPKDAPPRHDLAAEAEDGARLVADLALPVVSDTEQAQRLGQMFLKDARRMIRHTLSLGPEGLLQKPFDVWSWTSARNVYENKQFEVTSFAENTLNLSRTFALREVDPSDYTWTPSTDLLPSFMPSANVTAPAPQLLGGFDVLPHAITDTTNTERRPALRFVWAGDLSDVRAIVFQVRVKATGEDIARITTEEVDAFSLVFSDGIVNAVEYEARAQMLAGRKTIWTEWRTATSPNIRIAAVDIEPYTINFAQIAAEVTQSIAEGQATAAQAAEVAAAAHEAADEALENIDAAVASLTVDYDATQQAAANAQTARDEAEIARNTAATSASAAAASEALAAASKTAAGNSQIDAATSATNAEGSASQASSAQASAAASETVAGQSATAAATSAQTAATSATAAGQSASAADSDRIAAQTARGGAEAAQSASVAARESAEGFASAAATSATLSAGAAQNSAQSASAAATSEQTAAASQTAAGQSASTASSSAISAQTSAGQASTSASNAATSATDAEGSANSASNSFNLAVGAKDAASAAASAAASSASAASAASTAAGQSATSATNSANSASTSAGSASASQSSAASSANLASGSASAASSSATLAAQTAAQGAGVIISPYFADYGVIGGWSDWSDGATNSSVNEVYAQGKTLRFTTTTADSRGVSIEFDTGWSGPENAGAYVVEVVFTLLSGALGGAGVLLDWVHVSGNARRQISLSDMLVGELVLGQTMYASKVFKRPTLPDDFLAHDVFLMANFDGLGPREAKNIRFHRLQIRPATPEETGSGEVGEVISAAVSFEAGVRAGADQAIAASVTALTSTVGGVSASVSTQGAAIADLAGNAAASLVFRTQAGSSGAALELVSADSADDPDGPTSVARISADNILLEGSVGTDILAVGLGRNLLANTDFSDGPQGWHFTSSADQTSQSAFSLRPSGSTYAGEYYPVLQIYQNGTGQSGVADIRHKPVLSDGVVSVGVPVSQGDWIEASVKLSIHRCSASLRIQYYNSTGGFVAYSDVLASGNDEQSSSDNPDLWPVYWGKDQVPAGAAYATIHIRKAATSAGNTNSFVFVHKPQLAISHEAATQPAPFSPGGTTMITGDKVITRTLLAEHLAVGTIDAASGVIGDLAVGRLQIAGEAVSITNRTANNGVISGTLGSFVEIGTITVGKQDGEPTLIEMISRTVDIGGFSTASSNKKVNLDLEIRRTRAGVITVGGNYGSNIVASTSVTAGGPAGGSYGSLRIAPVVLKGWDLDPTITTDTYKLFAKVSNSGGPAPSSISFWGSDNMTEQKFK